MECLGICKRVTRSSTLAETKGNHDLCAAKNVTPIIETLNVPEKLVLPKESSKEGYSSNLNDKGCRWIKLSETGAKNGIFSGISIDESERLLKACFQGIPDGKITTTDDRNIAETIGSSLLFGEITVQGVSVAFDDSHLRGTDGTILFDLGMGLGKLAIQAFYQFPNLRKVIGIEFAKSRFERSSHALNRIPSCFEAYEVNIKSGCRNNCHVDESKEDARVLEFRCEDLFKTQGIEFADIVILQTNFYEHQHDDLIQLVNSLKIGARILSYKNLANIFFEIGAIFPYHQLSVNVSQADTFETSWSGTHHFYLYIKTK